MSEPTCGTCRFSEWNKGPRGGRLWNKAGRCGYVVLNLPPLPVCIEMPVLRKCGIWPNDTGCPVHEPKEKAK